MEGLTEYDFSGELVQLRPALAESWESSEDKSKWSFFLKDQVLWTDGKALEVQHFIDSWERLLNPQTASEYAYFLFPIKNAKAYNEGKIKDFKEVGVKVGDKGELIVELEKDFFIFLIFSHIPPLFPSAKTL